MNHGMERGRETPSSQLRRAGAKDGEIFERSGRNRPELNARASLTLPNLEVANSGAQTLTLSTRCTNVAPRLNLSDQSIAQRPSHITTMVTANAYLSDARYAFEYSGGVTGRAAIAKAMAEFGPLLIATDHVLAKLLPEELDNSHSPNEARNDTVHGLTTAHARSSFPARPGPNGRRAGVRVRGWGDARTDGLEWHAELVEGVRHGSVSDTLT